MPRKALAITALLLVGCVDNRPKVTHQFERTDVYVTGRLSEYYVHVAHDPVYQVTCWMHRDGISCLPDSAVVKR